MKAAEIVDRNAMGFMGKPGTFSHAANVGCLALLIGVVVLVLVLLATMPR
jgi:hypothetical protein